MKILTKSLVKDYNLKIVTKKLEKNNKKIITQIKEFKAKNQFNKRLYICMYIYKISRKNVAITSYKKIKIF